MEVGPPTLDRAEFFVVQDDKVTVRSVSGETVPFSGRPYSDRRIAFPVDSANSKKVIYLRITSDGWASARIRLWPEADYLNHRANKNILDGAYFGALGFVVILNFFLFFGFRDPVFLSYSALIATMLLFSAKLNGYLDQYFWPGMPELSNPAGTSLSFLAIIAASQFTRLFLQLRQRQPVINHAFTVLIAAAILAMIAQPITSFGTVLVMTVVLGLTGVAFWLTAMIRSVLQGYSPAIYLLIGQLLIGPATALLILRLNGIIQANTFTENIMEFAIASEAIIISLGLSARVAVLRREKESVSAALSASRAETAEKMVEVQEEERRRISGDLHDSVGQQLLVIANTLRQMKATGNTGSKVIDDLATSTGQVLDEVRSISHELHPHQVARIGFVASVRDLALRLLGEQGVEVSVAIDPSFDSVLPDEMQLHVFRAIQAALVNCTRHAHAQSVQIVGALQENTARVVIDDDGVGFDDSVSPSDGIGLHSIADRMALIGGTCTITSAPNEGTTVRLSVPLNGGIG